MLIKFVESIATPRKGYYKDDIAEWDDADAERLIARGIAVRHGEHLPLAPARKGA